MAKSLLSFDTDRIKNYVFATDKLKEIRGASAILDELNRQEMPKLVMGQKDDRTIFANGGSGLFLVEQEEAEAKKIAVEKIYREKTLTASISSAVFDLAGNIQGNENIQSEFATLSYRLRAIKDSKNDNPVLLTHPYLHFCASCGTEYAVTTGETDNELLCHSCATKRDKDSEIKEKISRRIRAISQTDTFLHEGDLWGKLLQSLNQEAYDHLKGYDRPDDFNKLAELSTPNNYIGLIYADGDSMGKILDTIETLDEMQKFSEAVDSGVYDAVVTAIVQHLQPAQSGSKTKIKNKDGSKPWPFDILLLGGDDLVMVTRADSVLEVGLTIMEQFTALTEEKYGQPLRLSVGIAIAHTNFPFGELLRLGESALKFAKQEGAKRRQKELDWRGGLLNFLVVTSANHLEFKDYYQGHLSDYAEENDREVGRKKTLHRTLRPYTAAEFKKLIDHVRDPNIAQIPRNKLQRIRQAIFQNRIQAMFDCLTLLFHWRSSKQQQVQAIQAVVRSFRPDSEAKGTPKQMMLFPWFQIAEEGEDPKYFTPLLDLIEIIDFISAAGRNRNDA